MIEIHGVYEVWNIVETFTNNLTKFDMVEMNYRRLVEFVCFLSLVIFADFCFFVLDFLIVGLILFHLVASYVALKVLLYSMF
jgi:hypothetical protein